MQPCNLLQQEIKNLGYDCNLANDVVYARLNKALIDDLAVTNATLKGPGLRMKTAVEGMLQERDREGNNCISYAVHFRNKAALAWIFDSQNFKEQLQVKFAKISPLDAGSSIELDPYNDGMRGLCEAVEFIDFSPVVSEEKIDVSGDKNLRVSLAREREALNNNRRIFIYLMNISLGNEYVKAALLAHRDFTTFAGGIIPTLLGMALRHGNIHAYNHIALYILNLYHRNQDILNQTSDACRSAYANLRNPEPVLEREFLFIKPHFANDFDSAVKALRPLVAYICSALERLSKANESNHRHPDERKLVRIARGGIGIVIGFFKTIEESVSSKKSAITMDKENELKMIVLSRILPLIVSSGLQINDFKIDYFKQNVFFEMFFQNEIMKNPSSKALPNVAAVLDIEGYNQELGNLNVAVHAMRQQEGKAIADDEKPEAIQPPEQAVMKASDRSRDLGEGDEIEGEVRRVFLDHGEDCEVEGAPAAVVGEVDVRKPLLMGGTARMFSQSLAITVPAPIASGQLAESKEDEPCSPVNPSFLRHMTARLNKLDLPAAQEVTEKQPASRRTLVL